MDLNQAIQLAQLVDAVYATPPDDLTNAAGTSLVAGGISYSVITTIYANDLATDVNPDGGNDQVSIGLVCQADQTGDVVIAVRGTEGIQEWIHDAEFLLVDCPFLPSAGQTEDGFTAMYLSLLTDTAPGSPTVVAALPTLAFPQPVKSLTICGHSLGGALATLLALDLAANTRFTGPIVYTYASPSVGDPVFVSKFNQMIKNSFRVANRLDLVTHLPLPPAYAQVNELFELNPIQLIPFEILVNPTLDCEHSLDSYLYLLSLLSGGPVLPLGEGCSPP